MRAWPLPICYSYFTFGVGVSSPTRLVERAAELSYPAVVLADGNGVYGAVEAQQAGRKYGVKVLIGATVTVEYRKATYPLVLIAQHRRGYEVLCDLLTVIHETKDKTVTLPVLIAHTEGLICLTGGRQSFPTRLMSTRKLYDLEDITDALKGAYPERLYMQLSYNADPDDGLIIRKLRDFAHYPNRVLPVVSAPEVRYATPDLFPVYDTLVCGRLGITIYDPHPLRPRNDHQHLPNPEEWKALPRHPLPFPDGIENAASIAASCNLDLLAQRLTPPPARIPEGSTLEQYLDERLYASLAEKYPHDNLSAAKARLEQELVTMKSLGLGEFFLLAAEITDYCRSHGIVASGRGSAAASVTCYLLGITTVDPIEHDLLFERFLHTGRTSLPDVDIDIGSSRRDEVLAWAERRFGRYTHAMVCNRQTYKLPSAVQDLGRGLGIPKVWRDELTEKLGRDFRGHRPHKARAAQEIFDAVLQNAPSKEVLIRLLEQLEKGTVRHISPHSGGVILSKTSLSHYSPRERSSGGIRLIQFDKDDSESLGLIKLDLLGLRMLGVFERCREEVFRLEGQWLELSNLPDDNDVWQSIRAGDTMGIFQIESPAQTHITVDVQPTSFKDLAHQVALIRPGPIQSGTVQPYVKRKKGLEPVTYIHPSLAPILGKSYGVLLFQEDILRIATQVAGYSWSDAETFRKTITSYEDEEEIGDDKRRFIEGCKATSGLTESEATEVFAMCAAYRGYGFAESHAWAFGLHAYTSAWLRHHFPAEYFAAILTEEPGMWPRSSLMQDVREKGVGIAHLDINLSGMSFSTERNPGGGKSIRIPLTSVKLVTTETARKIVLSRLEYGPYTGVKDLYERVRLDEDVLGALVRAGAFDRLQNRRDALYQLGALVNIQPPAQQPLLSALPETPILPELGVKERIVWDYAFKSMNEWGVHPIDLMRQELTALGATPMVKLEDGYVTTAGQVIVKQKPPTAKGYAFFDIEDGPNRVQVIISPEMGETNRAMMVSVRVLLVSGWLEKRGKAWTLRAERLVDPFAGRLLLD